MYKLIYKLGAGAITAALIGSTFAGASFASVNATIKGNGNNSDNTIKVSQSCSVGVVQSNLTFAGVLAAVTSDTGDNTANGNTGGDITIDTGKATSSLNVNVGGSSNSATIPDCCQCLSGNVNATIQGNGNNSTNKIRSKKRSRTFVLQSNITGAVVGAIVKSDTGDNKANGNTDGTVDVTTDNAQSRVDVTVNPSTNNSL